MTTISHDEIGRVRDDGPQPRSAARAAGWGAGKFWLWASPVWLASVAVTVAVDAGDAVTVAIGGMTLAAVCAALAHPEPGAVTEADRPRPERPRAAVEPEPEG